MNRRKSYLFIIFTSFFFWQLSFAGETGTHGGNAIVCGSGKNQKYELLDYYDAKLTQLNGYQLDLGPNGSFIEHIGYVLKRLSKLDPVAAKRFSDRAKIFKSETKFLTPAEMKKVLDTNELVNPALGCEKQQFAVQVFSPMPGQARYFVNEEIWNNADEITRAGLILHEIILRDGVELFQQSTSDRSSYYNAQISSMAMNNMTPDQYSEIVNASFGSSYSQSPICSFSTPKYNMQVCINGEVKEYEGRTRVHISSGNFVTDQGFVFTPNPKFGQVTILIDANGDLTDSAGFVGIIQSHGLGLKVSSYAHFKKNHHISSARLDMTQVETLSGISFTASSGDTVFDENYHFTNPVNVVENQSVQIGGTIIQISKDFRQVTFHANGALRTFYPASEGTIKVGGFTVPIASGGEIMLNSDGSVNHVVSGHQDAQYSVNGQNIQMSTVGFLPNGTIQSGRISFNTPVLISGKTVNISGETNFYKSGNVAYTYEIDTKSALSIGNSLQNFVGTRGFCNDWAFYENGSVAYGAPPPSFENFAPAISPNCTAAGLSAVPGIELPYGSWGSDSTFYDRDGRVCYLSKSYAADKTPSKLWDTILKINSY